MKLKERLLSQGTKIVAIELADKVKQLILLQSETLAQGFGVYFERNFVFKKEVVWNIVQSC